MKPKGEMVVNFRPQKSPIRFTCTFYTWLSAYVWAFDHPYSAVSNDDGVFVIARVPIGAEVFLMAWHEDLGYVLGGKNGKKLTFTDAANRLNFKIKK